MNSSNPPFPAQPEEGDLGRLMQAIECGSPIRVGMLRSGTIRYSVFTAENVRYWKTDDDSDYVALASLRHRVLEPELRSHREHAGFGPWFQRSFSQSVPHASHRYRGHQGQ